MLVWPCSLFLNWPQQSLKKKIDYLKPVCIFISCKQAQLWAGHSSSSCATQYDRAALVQLQFYLLNRLHPSSPIKRQARGLAWKRHPMQICFYLFCMLLCLLFGYIMIIQTEAQVVHSYFYLSTSLIGTFISALPALSRGRGFVIVKH